jgi:predicted transcriptional regulator of viral defense system
MEPATLPEELRRRPWFTFADARQLGLPKQSIYWLRDTGAIESLARGIYQATDSIEADPSLIAAAAIKPQSTLCLTSALARHDLTDEIPRMHDIALPRGTRHPRIDGPIKWHTFDAETFEIGRTKTTIGPGIAMAMYSAERCIIDAFRLRGREGHEAANQALKRWLKRPGSQPSTLLAMAQKFPRASGPLRSALEILL